MYPNRALKKRNCGRKRQKKPVQSDSKAKLIPLNKFPNSCVKWQSQWKVSFSPHSWNLNCCSHDSKVDQFQRDKRRNQKRPLIYPSQRRIGTLNATGQRISRKCHCKWARRTWKTGTWAVKCIEPQKSFQIAPSRLLCFAEFYAQTRPSARIPAA